MRIDQAEVEPRHAGRKERRAFAEDDRVHDHVVLVDEPALDELGGERRPADGDRAVELLLQLRQLIANVAANEPRTVLDRLELA